MQEESGPWRRCKTSCRAMYVCARQTADAGCKKELSHGEGARQAAELFMYVQDKRLIQDARRS